MAKRKRKKKGSRLRRQRRIVLLLVIVSALQTFGNFLAARTTNRRLFTPRSHLRK